MRGSLIGLALVIGCGGGGVGKEAPPGPLTESERSTLARLVRRTVVAHASGLHPHALTDGLRITARLRRRQAAFVTLRRGGTLRACEGVLPPPGTARADQLPLYQSAIYAARRATRAGAITFGDLAALEVTLSLLSRPRRIERPDEIRVGHHGVIVPLGRHKVATLLPHVAKRRRWNRDQTLDALRRKARLSPEAWRGRTLFVYTETTIATRLP